MISVVLTQPEWFYDKMYKEVYCPSFSLQGGKPRWTQSSLSLELLPLERMSPFLAFWWAEAQNLRDGLCGLPAAVLGFGFQGGFTSWVIHCLWGHWGERVYIRSDCCLLLHSWFSLNMKKLKLIRFTWWSSKESAYLWRLRRIQRYADCCYLPE